MKFGYTILYVKDVPSTMSFYEKAFGLKIKFLHDGHQYGEMDTGGTTLAFVAEAFLDHPGLAYKPNRLRETSAGFEIAFVTPDVEKDFQHALASGAEFIQDLQKKPWGQTVGYVKDLNGVIIEVCSPMTPEEA